MTSPPDTGAGGVMQRQTKRGSPSSVPHTEGARQSSISPPRRSLSLLRRDKPDSNAFINNDLQLIMQILNALRRRWSNLLTDGFSESGVAFSHGFLTLTSLALAALFFTPHSIASPRSFAA